MKKLADRLAHRKSQEHQLMKELVYLTNESLTTENHLALEDRLEALLSELPVNSFESLYWKAVEELAHAEDADALRFELQATLESLISEAIYRDKTVRLVGLPFALACQAQAAWDQPVTPELEAQLKSMLVEQGWVAPDSIITVFPQILTASAGGALPYGTVYRMREKLAEGDREAALVAYREGLGSIEGESSVPLPDAVVLTGGILLMAVVSREDEVLPMDFELHRMLEQVQTPEEADAVYAEVAELHDQFLQGLLPHLNGVAIEPCGAFGDWFESLYAMRRLQREVLARQAILDAVGAKINAEPKDLVSVNGPPEVRYSDKGLPRIRVHLVDRATGTPRHIDWPSFAEEPAHECFEQLQAFLSDMGLAGAPKPESFNSSAVQLDEWGPMDDIPPSGRVLH